MQVAIVVAPATWLRELLAAHVGRTDDGRLVIQEVATEATCFIETIARLWSCRYRTVSTACASHTVRLKLYQLRLPVAGMRIFLQLRELQDSALNLSWPLRCVGM